VSAGNNGGEAAKASRKSENVRHRHRSGETQCESAPARQCIIETIQNVKTMAKWRNSTETGEK